MKTENPYLMELHHLTEILTMVLMTGSRMDPELSLSSVTCSTGRA